MKSLIPLIAVFFLTVVSAFQPQNPVTVGRFTSDKHSFYLVQLYKGLRHPWSLACLSDGKFLMTERGGRLLLLENNTLIEVMGLPEIAVAGQGGLLDLALDPDFQENKLIYFSYSSPGNGGKGTAVAKARFEDNKLKDVQVIWKMNLRTSSNIHFGSRLRFMKDGTLLITTGERGEMNRAQNPSDDAGKVHRIKADGTIPVDNPFTKVKGARPSIYSYGHRNPQGLAVHPETGIVWATEHGPKGGDELNLIQPGGNYGWPVVTHGKQYGSGAAIGEGTSKNGMIDPVIYWTPSPAPSGLEFYEGGLFPEWKGDLFSGNLAGKRLIRIRLDKGRVAKQEVLFSGVIGRIRDVRTDAKGYLYLLTDEDQGALYRIEPAK